jgi:hypothetical protein
MKLSLVDRLLKTGAIDYLDNLKVRGPIRASIAHLVDGLHKEVILIRTELARLVKEYEIKGDKLAPNDPISREVILAFSTFLEGNADIKVEALFGEAEMAEFEMSAAQERAIRDAGLVKTKSTKTQRMARKNT